MEVKFKLFISIVMKYFLHQINYNSDNIMDLSTHFFKVTGVMYFMNLNPNANKFIWEFDSISDHLGSW